jgi:hypothetical protein
MPTLQELIAEGCALLDERVRVSTLPSLHDPNREHHRSLVTLHKGKSARHYVLSTVRTSDKGPESMAFRSNSKGTFLSKLWGRPSPGKGVHYARGDDGESLKDLHHRSLAAFTNTLKSRKPGKKNRLKAYL